ncbi:class I SAM-dependent methyltransferase [Desulfotignum phosphitoxidans]|nr:class I SAM-dependent methyltransferase [Desulfotignum phosphitoxidans]
MKNEYMQNDHPFLKDDFIKKYIKQDIDGQLYSVEASLESLIPWIDYVTDIQNNKILVFGTGGGGTAVACALKVGNGKVYGIDINSWAVDTTKERSRLYGTSDKLILKCVDDSYPLPFPDEYFDIVIMADVIEHIIEDRVKYVQECFTKLKKDGYFIITGTPNLFYPKDRHTTGLYFIPWLPSKIAYHYSVFRKKWQKGKNLDYAGRKGTTYFHIMKWLKPFSYVVLNVEMKNFTSQYLINHHRINSFKRKLFFKPYLALEFLLQRFLKLPITAFMPYLNHLFIQKK